MHSRIAAKLPAWLLLSLMFVLAGVFTQRPPDTLVLLLQRAGLDQEQVHTVAFPVLFLLALMACFMIVHWLDRKLGGDGLSDRVLRKSNSALTASGYCYNQQVVQGLLSKQAVFTALAVALLVTVAGALLFSAIPLPPAKRWLLGSVAVALVLTLLLALTSITCYTHALQFQWQDEYGKALVRLGSKFDGASFYLLSGSLLLAAALWRPWATYAFGLLFALLLYQYYFFRLRRR